MKCSKNKSNRYSIQVIRRNGVACVSISETGHKYNINGRPEPKGKTYGPFKDKHYKRGTLLRKLGIWENGQNSTLTRKPKLLDGQ